MSDEGDAALLLFAFLLGYCAARGFWLPVLRRRRQRRREAGRA